MGSLEIESLECCIHFLSAYTFAVVKILKGKIRVGFTLSRKIKSKRINQIVQMSTNRYLYSVDIAKDEDIDEELLEWIREARDKKITNKKISA